MSRLYVIPAGGHSARGLHAGAVVGNTLLRFKAKFYPNCIYQPTREPEQVSKLFGISYGHHHEASARIGWRSDGRRIEVLTYVYLSADRRVHDHLAWIDVQEWHEFIIVRDGRRVSLCMDGGKPLSYMMERPIPAGYRLFPYFGGEVPAPHELWIEVEVLEMNGIGG
jgi:hypothetical protein